jgi:CBS domain-containing protein
MHQDRGTPSIQRVESLAQKPALVTADTPVPDAMTAAADSNAGFLIVTGEDGIPVGYLTAETLLARTPGTSKATRTYPESRSGLVLPEKSSLLTISKTAPCR